MRVLSNEEILSVPYTDALVYVILQARDNVFFSIKQYFNQKNNVTLNNLKSDFIYLYLNVYKFMNHDVKMFNECITKINTSKSFDELIDFINVLEDWLIEKDLIKIGRSKQVEEKSSGGF